MSFRSRLASAVVVFLFAAPALLAQGPPCVCSGYNTGRAEVGWSFVDGDYFSRARLNLRNTAFFGTGGVVPRAVTIAAGTATATDSTLGGVDVFFTGYTQANTFSASEKSTLRTAVLNGMSLVVMADDPNHSIADLFDVTLGPEAGTMNSPAIPDHPVFAGPFGRIVQFRNAGPAATFRGWSEPRVQALATSSGGPTMLLFPRQVLGPAAGAVLLLGDTDQLTTYGRDTEPNSSEPSVPVTDALVMNLVSFLCNPTAPAVAPHLVFPQIANGQGTVSSINLTNSDSLNVTANFSLRDDSGAPYGVNIVGRGAASVFASTLIPTQTLSMFTDGVGNLNQGTLTIQGSSLLGGNVIFFTPGLGVTSVPASPMAGGFLMPVVQQPIFTTLPGSGVSIDVFMGVAISNLSARTATVRVELWDDNGRRSDGVRTIIIPARGHIAKFLFQEPFFPNFVFTGFRGTLKIVSRDALLAVTALQLGSSTGQFTAIPVTPTYR